MQLFYRPDIGKQSIITLDKEEAKHCIKVLRKQVGDTIDIVDGVGGLYKAELITDDIKDCQVRVVEHIEEFDKRNFKLWIAIAPPKNISRFEWFLEKATEIGVDRITPIYTQHSERRNLKPDRLKKILIGAMKQSGKAYLPVLDEPMKYKELLDVAGEGKGITYHIATCRDNLTHLKEVYGKGNSTLILIGPEGDFTPQEVQMAEDSGYKPISLGSSRLRLETAGIVAVTIVNLLNE